MTFIEHTSLHVKISEKPVIQMSVLVSAFRESSKTVGLKDT